ncbi:unnamed protein product [Closterium sp. Yama58-4]|nr:unnamed protein product [Closterium sp. Yama58-4]
MARKRNSVASTADMCPRDLNKIPIVDDAAFDGDADDQDYNECNDACDNDADFGEEEDKGMSDSEDGGDADEDACNDEEAQPAAPTPRRVRATAAAGTKTAAKGGEPPRAAAKTRNLHPVKRSKQWRNLVTMFKQLKKGEKASGKGAVCKPPWYPYMELFQNNKAIGNPHVFDDGGAAHFNVPCGFAIPSTSAPCTYTPTFTGAFRLRLGQLVCAFH